MSIVTIIVFCYYYYIIYYIIIIIIIIIIKIKERSKEQSIARQQKTNSYKTNFFLRINVSMISLSLDELKLVAKNRGIKDYKNKSEDDLIKILSEPKTKTSLSKRK